MATGGSVIWNLDAESKGFDSKIKKASKDARDFGHEINNIKVDGVLNKAGDALGKVGDTIVSVAKKATVAFGAATLAATAFSIKSAANFEQTRIGLENMLGSADGARSLLKDISKFAAETPFEFPELAQATRQLVAFGFTGKEAFDTMKQLGNVSAAVGAPINDLAYLMGTLRAQGRAFTIDIRQFAQRGIPIYEYLGKVLNKNTQQITEMIEAGQIGFPEVQKAFQLLAGEGGKWGDTMARQSKSLSGLFSTLKDVLGQTGRELVGITQEGDIKEGSIFARLRDAVDGLTVNLPKMIAQMQQIVTDIMPQLKQWASNIVEVGKQIGDYLAPKLSALWDTLQKEVIPTLTRLWKEVIVPLIPVIGTLLVAAIGLAIDYLNLWLNILTPVMRFMLDNKGTVIGLATAFGVLYAAMKFNDVFNALTIGFNTLKLVTIPSMMTSIGNLRLLITSPLGFGAIAIGAALIALGAIYDAAQKARSAIEGAKSAAESASKSNDEVIRRLQAQTQAPYSPEVQARARKTLAGLAAGNSFAKGTSFAPGGTALVGERGPEIVNLPRGSEVIPNHKLGANAEYNIGTINISSEADGERWLKKLTRNQEIFDNGLTPARNAF